MMQLLKAGRRRRVLRSSRRSAKGSFLAFGMYGITSKEEAPVLARMKRRRSHTWKRMLRHLILFSVIFEIIAVGYAIVTTRTLDLDRKTRSFRVLTMFLLPALSFAAYSALVRFMRMRIW